MEDNRDERVPMESARRDLTNKTILWAKNNKESSIILFLFFCLGYTCWYYYPSPIWVYISCVCIDYTQFFWISNYLFFFFSSCCTTRHICDDDAVISKRNCFKYLFAFFFDRHHTHSNANKNKLKGIDDEYKTIEIMAPVIWTRLQYKLCVYIASVKEYT